MSVSIETIPNSGYHLEGPPGAPVIAALGGISASRHVQTWWRGTAGPGAALDVERFRILGIEYADGGCDSRGFPERTVSTFDQASVLAAALDDAGIDRLHALVGASYGGMVALAFAERFPDRVDRLVVIGAAHRAHPMTSALRIVQRRVVELGLASGDAREAVAIARALAVTTYRSADEFATRFHSLAALDDYLRGHGERFAARFSPARYLALSLSADTHVVDPARITTRTTLVSIQNDAVVPRRQVEELAALLSAPVRLAHLHSPKGHDGFLTQHTDLAPILSLAIDA